MSQHKLTPQRENKRHFQAFQYWRDLGYGRSFNKVAIELKCSPQSVSDWHKKFDWDERLNAFNTTIKKQESAADLLKPDDPMAHRLVKAMDHMEALIGSAFKKDPNTGKTVAIVKVKTAEDLTKLLEAQRKYLETYHKFIQPYLPKDKEGKRQTNIKELNLNMGELSQEERIGLLKGAFNGNVKGRDSVAERGVSEADYTEVPERGTED